MDELMVYYVMLICPSKESFGCIFMQAIYEYTAYSKCKQAGERGKEMKSQKVIMIPRRGQLQLGQV